MLKRANARGATTVTDPIPFYGESTLGRMLDPWLNLWWLWSPAPGQPDPDSDSDTMFTTLDAVLRSMAHAGARVPGDDEDGQSEALVPAR